MCVYCVYILCKQKLLFWMQLIAINRLTALDYHTLRELWFYIKSVKSNLLSGSNFRQPASTTPDCKLGQKFEQKSCRVYSSFKSATWASKQLPSNFINT